MLCVCDIFAILSDNGRVELIPFSPIIPAKAQQVARLKALGKKYYIVTYRT